MSLQKTEKTNNFLYLVLGIEIVDFKRKHDKIEFPEPVQNKEKRVQIFNPITLLVFKRRLVKGFNEELTNKIKGIVSFKVRVVGTGEEIWI